MQLIFSITKGWSFVIGTEFKGFQLNEIQIRLLLQKKVIFKTTESKVIVLSDKGDLMELEIPKEQKNRPQKVFNRRSR